MSGLDMLNSDLLILAIGNLLDDKGSPGTLTVEPGWMFIYKLHVNCVTGDILRKSDAEYTLITIAHNEH